MNISCCNWVVSSSPRLSTTKSCKHLRQRLVETKSVIFPLPYHKLVDVLELDKAQVNHSGLLVITFLELDGLSFLDRIRFIETNVLTVCINLNSLWCLIYKCINAIELIASFRQAHLLRLLALSLIEWILTAANEKQRDERERSRPDETWYHTLIERYSDNQLLVNVAFNVRIVWFEDVTNIVFFLLVKCINLVRSYMICQINVSRNAKIVSTAAAAAWCLARNRGVMQLYVSFNLSGIRALDFCYFLSSFIEVEGRPTAETSLDIQSSNGFLAFANITFPLSCTPLPLTWFSILFIRTPIKIGWVSKSFTLSCSTSI